jgi:hypothetical protein
MAGTPVDIDGVTGIVEAVNDETVAIRVSSGILSKKIKEVRARLVIEGP